MLFLSHSLLKTKNASATTQSLKSQPSAWMSFNQIRLLSVETLWPSQLVHQLQIRMQTACRKTSMATLRPLFIVQAPNILTLSPYRSSEIVNASKWRSQRSRLDQQASRDWIGDESINFFNLRTLSPKMWQQVKSLIKNQAQSSLTKLTNFNKANPPIGSKTNETLISLGLTVRLMMNRQAALHSNSTLWTSSLTVWAKIPVTLSHQALTKSDLRTHSLLLQIIHFSCSRVIILVSMT